MKNDIDDWRDTFRPTDHLDVSQIHDAATPPHYQSTRITSLVRQGNSCWTRFKTTGDFELLQTGIEQYKELLTLVSHDGDSTRALALACIGQFLYATFEKTEELTYLYKAIANGEEALAAMPCSGGDYYISMISSNLAHYLYVRFKLSGKLDDLHLAVTRGEEALAAISDDSPDRVRKLKGLCCLLEIKFQKSGDACDLRMAILRHEEALAIISDNSPDRGELLNSLIILYLVLYKQTGNLDKLQMAIRRGEDAMAAIPHESPDKIATLVGLAMCFLDLSEGTSDLSYQRKAILYAEEALAEISHHDPGEAAFYSNIARVYLCVAEQTGNMECLQIAIEYGEKAVAKTPGDDMRRGTLLMNLSIAFRIRFEQTNNLDNLQTSIMLGETALQETPHDHLDRAGILNSLAASLQQRYERIGGLEDLDRAIILGEEALKITPNDNIVRASRLRSRAFALQMRYQKKGDPDDLRTAIARGEEAVARIPHGHIERPNGLNSLAMSLMLKFSQTKDLGDLQSAIAKIEEALEALSEDSTKIGYTLINLGRCLSERFKKLDHMDDLQMAIKHGKKALETTPHDHANRGLWLYFVAGFVHLKFKRTSERTALNEAVSLYVDAADSPHTPTRFRIWAADLAGGLLATIYQWREANRITELAVNLLPKVAPRQLSQPDQQHMLREFSGLATKAASIALEANRTPLEAVQLLELGRGIITGLRSGLRSDVTELRERHPQISEKFEHLRNILDAPAQYVSDLVTEGDSSNLALQGTDRHQASSDLEDTINEIRHLPDFENFLSPPQVMEMNAAASSGPVVLINVSKFRSDALLIESTSIRSIRLPDLHDTDVKKKVKILMSVRSISPSSGHVGTAVNHVLEWLWDVAVHPVLDELGFLDLPLTDDWPRIWWIPTGELSLLPLHAAGRHASSRTDTALDRVISSYSPSVKALLYAREHPKKSCQSMADQALLVSMTTTTKCSDLRFAKHEVDKLEGILPASMKKLKLEQPCSKDVVEGLNECSIFHFAGHGISHPTDSAKSSLLTKDWEKNPLTVEQLINLNLRERSPWLAYLSACSTSESHSTDLRDEGIHLVTACQLAGFRHVVGSLWEISDQYSVQVAEQVYRTIYGPDTIHTDAAVSLGVHKAVRHLRNITRQEHEKRCTEPSTSRKGKVEEMGPRDAKLVKPKRSSKGHNPLIWAAYIHVGP